MSVAPLLQVICHGIPDRRPLEDGDIVNVDVTAFFKGYHGDLNETFVVGDSVDDASKQLVRVASEVGRMHEDATTTQLAPSWHSFCLRHLQSIHKVSARCLAKKAHAVFGGNAQLVRRACTSC